MDGQYQLQAGFVDRLADNDSYHNELLTDISTPLQCAERLINHGPITSLDEH
jgi:hypothetical protein